MLRTQRVLLNDEQTAVGIAAVFIAAAEDAGGRRMEMAVLKDTYQRLLGDGQRLFTTHSGDIQRRAATLSPAEVINLVRSPAGPPAWVGDWRFARASLASDHAPHAALPVSRPACRRRDPARGLRRRAD
jgi:hypothetical protein